MSVPKYKKPKWNVAECKDCKRFMQESNIGYCKRRGHRVIPRANVPFMIPGLKFKSIYRTYSGTSRAIFTSSNMDKIEMSMGDFEKVIPFLEYGVLNKKCWFMWTRKSSRLGVTFLGEDK